MNRGQTNWRGVKIATTPAAQDRAAGFFRQSRLMTRGVY